MEPHRGGVPVPSAKVKAKCLCLCLCSSDCTIPGPTEGSRDPEEVVAEAHHQRPQPRHATRDHHYLGLRPEMGSEWESLLAGNGILGLRDVKMTLSGPGGMCGVRAYQKLEMEPPETQPLIKPNNNINANIFLTNLPDCSLDEDVDK
ncbi:GD18812 [Drosophila simulans]|uniref:GD18812 n=1 Tax=Drosophila simulans TaxID=7240 RepID=B4QSY5_DROSI|nr:GD18812 [Drosophila simulans]